MTDRSKFEQMLEYLISDEQDKAKEIFHQLVVEKSREIYETILSEDFGLDEEEKDDSDEGESDDSEDSGDDDSGDVGGDATDDFMSDVDDEGSDDEGSDDLGGDGDIEDRVMDLEDALDDLRAEFEQMMGAEEGEGHDEFGGDEFGGDEMGDMGDEMGDMGDEDEMEMPVKDSFDFSDNFMREYIEKVTAPKHGDDGVNNKSIVASKNDMGGTTANIAKGGTEGGKGVQSGLLKPTTKEENFGNINVPGGNAGKTAFKKKEPGHGAEKKGTGDNGDKSAGSPINGAPNRAK